MGREFELKYASTASVLASLQQEFGDFSKIQMETTYFDTPDSQLSAKKMTLRLRRENESSICTLKTPLSDGSRGEWECESASIEDGMARLLSMGAPAILAELPPVTPVCGARFTRLCKTIAVDGGTAELALDRGVLLGGGEEIPLCEVEVELKSGSEEAAVRFAEALAREFGLKIEPRSKVARARALTQK